MNENLFLKSEKTRQSKLKKDFLSLSACINGSCIDRYGKIVHPHFCINDNLTEENIFKYFRDEAISYFSTRGIKWHRSSKIDLPENKPDNHLCCSQSFCINSLFYFINKPEDLNNLLNQLGYKSKEILSFDVDKPHEDNNYKYVCFEWFGEKNYLCEMRDGKILEDNKRVRGEGCTNADFAIRFMDIDNKVNIILGEWKYTEAYDERHAMKLKSKIYRHEKIYSKSLENSIYASKSPTGNILDIYDEPLYQLMRLQLLAQQMQIHKEMGAEKVTVLLIVPMSNLGYKESFYTSNMNKFKSVGVMDLWSSVINSKYFKYLYLEDLFNVINNCIPLNSWKEYLNVRYKWW